MLFIYQGSVRCLCDSFVRLPHHFRFVNNFFTFSFCFVTTCGNLFILSHSFHCVNNFFYFFSHFLENQFRQQIKSHILLFFSVRFVTTFLSYQTFFSFASTFFFFFCIYIDTFKSSYIISILIDYKAINYSQLIINFL